MKQATVNYMQTAKNDELYTPDYAVDALLNNIQLKAGATVWCPCDTDASRIVLKLRERGFNVIASHIQDDKDFFQWAPDEEYDYIITNPPYSCKDQILLRCYTLRKPFALLLPLTALEGIKRGKMFREYGVSVLVLDQRCDFSGKGSCWFNTSWFVYGIGEPNSLKFVEVNKNECK